MEENLIKKETAIVAIKRVKKISFSINEGYARSDVSLIKSLLEVKMGFNAPQNLVKLELRAYYVYDESPDQIVMEITVENVFELLNLSDFIPTDQDVTSETMNIPSKILVQMVAISVSHTRALFGEAISGTVMDATYLPVTDPVLAAKAFFRGKIKDEEL